MSELLKREKMARALFEVGAPPHQFWDDVGLDKRELYLWMADAALSQGSSDYAPARRWPKVFNVKRAHNTWNGEIAFAREPSDDELKALEVHLRDDHRPAPTAAEFDGPTLTEEVAALRKVVAESGGLAPGVDERSAATSDTARACTCHPDDNPPVPCAQKFAYSECAAAASPEPDAVREIVALRDRCRHEAKKTDSCYTCYTDQAADIANRLDAILALFVPRNDRGSPTI